MKKDRSMRDLWLKRFELSLSVFVAIILFFLMALTFFDVLGRYGLNAPIPGASELTELCMGLLIFGALPIITSRSEHVTIGLLDMILGARSRRVERPIMLSVSFIALCLMTWRLWQKANELASYGDTSSYLRIPLAPFAYFMSLMAGASLIIVFLQSIHFFAGTDSTQDR